MVRRSYLVSCLVLAAVTGLLVIALSDDLPKVAGFLAKLTLVISLAGGLGMWALKKLYGHQQARAVFANTTLVAVSVVVSLVGGEAVTRLVFRDITTTADNTSYFANRWRQMHPPAINRWGFREREFGLRPSEEIYRIAVVGDSFTYGQGIVVENRLSNILEGQLNEHRNQYEVLNFGRPGAETKDHIDILRDVVLKIQPRYVLLQWFRNDVEGDNKGERPKPWRLLPSDFLLSYLHTHSALYYFVNQQWIKMQRRLGFIEGHQAYMERRFKDPSGIDARRARRELETFFELCNQQRVPVGMILFPALADSASQDHTADFLIDWVLSICSQQSVPCLDLRTVFATISPPTLLWANRLDAHPGRLANQLAAEAVLRKFGPIWGTNMGNHLRPELSN
jgi:hypothetical protein